MADEKLELTNQLRIIEETLRDTFNSIVPLYFIAERLGVPEIILTDIECRFAIAHDELVNEAYEAVRKQLQNRPAECQKLTQNPSPPLKH